MLTYHKTIQQNCLVLALEGQLNAQTSRELQGELELLCDEDVPRVILDMSSLLQIDSTGVGVVVSLFKLVKTKDKTFALAGLQGQPYDIFKLLNLHKVLTLSPSLDEALQAPSLPSGN